MVPTVQAIRQQSRQKPEEVLTDSGYCSELNLKYLEKENIEGFVATSRESHGDQKQPCPRGPLPQGATRMDRMRRKLQTKAGAAVYATRKVIVEPVFGQIKQARGFRQVLLRGLEKVQEQVAIDEQLLAQRSGQIGQALAKPGAQLQVLEHEQHDQGGPARRNR
jgi:hypothetical protein